MKAQTEETRKLSFVCSRKELYKVLSTIKMRSNAKVTIATHLAEHLVILKTNYYEIPVNDKSAFGFRKNADLGDFYGESVEHSPIWVRPISLGYCNIYKRTDVIQIVGHSKVDTITEDLNVVFVDCLESVAKSKRITWD